MKVTIDQEPCWLLEAAELVYGLVNQLPVEKLAGSGPYCIPPDQVRRIQAEACAGLDPLDEVVQFYFRGVPLEGVSGRLSCLGCALLYSFLEIDHPQPDEFVQAMKLDWHALCKTGFHVEGIDGFSLSFEPTPGGKFLSLARELAALQVPALYRMQLLEVFSAYDQHLERVAELLRPVAAALPSYMAPWTDQIPALAGQWEAFFEGGAAQEFFLRRARIQSGAFLELKLGFRFFSPYGEAAVAFPHGRQYAARGGGRPSGPGAGGVGADRPAAHGQWRPGGDAPRHDRAPHERPGAGPETESQFRLCISGPQQPVQRPAASDGVCRRAKLLPHQHASGSEHSGAIAWLFTGQRIMMSAIFN